jgi:hypothetical protein
MRGLRRPHLHLELALPTHPDTALHPVTEPPPETASGGRSRPVWRYLDVVFVVLSLVPALALGAPAFGYGLGVGGWILQRMVGIIDKHWLRKLADPVKQAGFSLFEAFGRIWLLAGVIVLAGVVGGRRDGLAASLVILGAYSIAFVIKLISGPPGRRAVR